MHDWPTSRDLGCFMRRWHSRAPAFPKFCPQKLQGSWCCEILLSSPIMTVSITSLGPPSDFCLVRLKKVSIGGCLFLGGMSWGPNTWRLCLFPGRMKIGIWDAPPILDMPIFFEGDPEKSRCLSPRKFCTMINIL